MAAAYRSLTRLWPTLLIGAVLGAAVVLLLLALVRSVAPERYVGSVLLFAPEVEGDTTHGRRRLQVTLDEAGFMARVVQGLSVSRAVAAELARTVQLQPAGPTAALTELSARAHDKDELLEALNALSQALVQRRRDYASRRLNARMSRMDTRIEVLRTEQVRNEKRLDGVVLPIWAQASATALATLEAEQFGLQLALQLESDTVDQVAGRLNDIAGQLAQMRLGVGGELPVLAEVMDAAIARAVIPQKISHLLSARETLRARRLEQVDLRIVRTATAVPVPPPIRRGMWAAVFGAAIGALGAFVLRVGRPTAKAHRDGPTLESHLHVRVIGSMASALVDYGDRKMRPLAQTHPQHLAVDGVRSLHTALTVLKSSKDHGGPVVMANAGDSQNAGHVLANLAMLAANRGERVLLIETESGGSVLSSLFTTGTRTTLSTIMDTDELVSRKKMRAEKGRIRFVVADDDGSPDPPVPGAFVHYFDRVYVRAHSVGCATATLKAYGGGVGVLVGSDRLPIRQWQSARDQWRESDEPLDGLVHCGHRIDERAYASR